MIKTTSIPELTDEQFNILNEYVWVFNKARNGYVTGFTSQVADDIFGIYEQLGRHISNRNCPSCVIDALKYMAAVYDAAYEKRKNDLISVEDAPEQPATKKTKKSIWQKLKKKD